MIRDTDKRHAGGVPVAADGTTETITELCTAKPLFEPPKCHRQPERYMQLGLKFF
jgi:hypothetical protein